MAQMKEFIDISEHSRRKLSLSNAKFGRKAILFVARYGYEKLSESFSVQEEL